MNDFRNVTELELAEAYAEYFDLPYTDEESTSEIFDETIAPLVIQEYGVNDTIAMHEAFNNWTDDLCKSGQIHASQYREYCYVGEHSVG